MNEFLKAKLLGHVAKAVRLRDAADYKLSMQEQPSLPILVCVGPGRCLFPKDDGAESRVCPFCLRVESVRGQTEADVVSRAKRHIEGN